jgi:AcrR family transcriptional regulator
VATNGSSVSDLMRDRILGAARKQLFTLGYRALSMDGLAAELGMSKKTLYVHFAGKDVMVDEIVLGFAEEVKAMAIEVFSNETLGYSAKLGKFAESMTGRFSRVTPTLFRELQRYAPTIYQHIEEVRFTNIPIIFGRIIEEGQRVGMVREGVDPVFATEFWRFAIQGLMHPDSSERLGLRPDQVFNQALNLFCGGLLTSAGMNDYEKQVHA